MPFPSSPFIPGAVCPCSHIRHSRRLSGNGRGGFALLITITLLAFLVLLLVSLASLTRVETQVASNHQTLSLARQNALMAFEIALGELQKYAGPDQRVTATADIKGTATGTADAAINNPYFTGVWDATPADPILPPTLVAGTPLAWLVSGTTPSTTTNYSATGALLVGPKTVLNTAHYVYAPKVDISSTLAPGLGGATTTIGRFAYWVGDEGVKARVNLADRLAPHPAGSGGSPAAFAPTARQVNARLSAAQRPGVETIPGLADITQIHNEDAAAVTAREHLDRSLQYDQLPLFDTTWSQPSTRDRLRGLYHDLSTVSNGVLADNLNGGLRADLTYLFERATLTSFRTELNKVLTGNNAIGAATQANPSDTGLVPKLVPPETTRYSWAQGPTWYQLRSFYLSAGALNAGGEAVPRAQRPTVHGIYPVITQFRMRVGAQARETSVGVHTMEGVFSPLIVIANPYDVPIAAANYLVKTEISGRNGFTLKNTDLENWGNIYIGTVYFRLEGVALAPGEARVYTLRAGDTSAGWNASLGCYTWGNGGRYPMENDLNLDNCHIAASTPSNSITAFPTATSAELAAGVGGNLFYLGGSSITYLYLEIAGLTTNPGVSQLLQRIQGSLSGDATPGYGLDCGTINAAGTPKWPGATSDAFGFYLLSPLDSPGVNMYQSTNWRAYSRSFFGVGDGIGTWATGFGFANPTGWRNNMLVASDSQTALWGMRNRGSNPPANDSASGAPAALSKAIFFDVPTATSPIVSLGQLQHFNATGFSISASPGAEIDNVQSAGATYAIGNSHASPYVTRAAYHEPDAAAGNATLIKDASYLLNRTLWDTWFFSTVPQSGTFDFADATERLGNPRLIPFRSTLASTAIASYRSGPFDAASNLLLEGGFNVNSTSVEAWRALFSSLNQIPYPGTATKLTGAFARTLKQTGGSPATTAGNNGVSDGAWSGYRNLTTDQIDALATEMVKQVRLRGPFASLADFVNRRIENTPNGLMGALEAAIEATETYAADKRINNLAEGRSSSPLYFNAPTLSPGDRNNVIKDVAHHESSQVAGIPGILKQADLLQALGPVITARSDTFTIRTYGETVNPLDSTVVTGRAWCEAVVQRLPDYVGGEPASTAPADLLATSPSVTFGRRFQVVSFRWLNSDDI